jgi:hypothetical protein
MSPNETVSLYQLRNRCHKENSLLNLYEQNSHNLSLAVNVIPRKDGVITLLLPSQSAHPMQRLDLTVATQFVYSWTCHQQIQSF